MGTIVHKVMECLGKAKEAIQAGQEVFIDDVAGEVNFKVDKIYTDGFVEFLFDKSYTYYTARSTHEYTEKDRLTMLAWTYKPLRLCNGAFDPRERDIIKAELHFDFTIPDDWATYEYKLHDGQTVRGQLALKGTIDLVTRIDDNIYESIDWKTGQRLDWASNKPWPHNIKTYEKLIDDPQLRIYHYALHQMYPDIEQLIPTIIYINDHGTKNKPVPGGAFSMAYHKDEIEETKLMIKKQFERIKNNNRPQLVKTWKCNSFCHFGKTAHPSGKIDPRTGEPYTICEYVARRIREVGIDKTTQEETHPGHSVFTYHQPGA